MRNAYAILGLTFIIVFGSAYVLYEHAQAPTIDDVSTSEGVGTLSLTSSEFVHDGLIPSRYTCDGENISAPLSIRNVPEGTESFVLVMDDPDIPEVFKAERGIEKFNHWAVYNIPADTTEIPEGGAVGTGAENGRGELSYTGPCPPREYEPTTHRYVFRLYALSGQLNFITTPTLDEIEAAAQGISLGSATLVGVYERVAE